MMRVVHCRDSYPPFAMNSDVSVCVAHFVGLRARLKTSNGFCVFCVYVWNKLDILAGSCETRIRYSFH